RNMAPPLPFESLRNIVRYFPAPTSCYLLDPSFEPDMKGRDPEWPDPDPENTKIFEELQGMRDEGLVEPEGAKHMYYAAINRRGCILTPDGKYYWRLANMKKFGVVDS
ncbi:MAG: caspase family protein, partial [Verrucomicrobiota bacterium]